MQNNPGFTQQEVRKVQEAWALQPRFGYVPTRNELVLAVGSWSALAAPIPSAPAKKQDNEGVKNSLKTFCTLPVARDHPSADGAEGLGLPQT